jgi:hypothetical protein
MVEALARELAEGAFDRLSRRDRELLIQAATLKLLPRRRGEDMVRRANCISRLLARIHGLRQAEPKPSSNKSWRPTKSIQFSDGVTLQRSIACIFSSVCRGRYS